MGWQRVRTKRNHSRFEAQFENAKETRLRLIELQRCADMDFPCEVPLVDVVALGRVLGLDTVRTAELTQWLRQIEEGYLHELSKTAAEKRGEAQSAYDRLPSIDDYLCQHEDKDHRLLDFAKRLLALSDEKRRACVAQVNGAPHDSEMPEFAPRRRGLVRGIGGATADEDTCGSHVHACVIQVALKGIGPTATVRPIAQFGPLEQAFRPLWSLATVGRIPYLWIGPGDPQKSLTALYVGECVRAVRYEYEWWVGKAPALLTEDNPVLRWLSAPSEPNRLAALNFALRHVAETRDDQEGKDFAAPDATGYVASPSDASSYVPMATIRAKYCEGVALTTIKEVTKVLEDFPTNRVRWTRPPGKTSGAPHPKRRSVHLVDWEAYVDRLKNQGPTTSEESISDPSPAEIETGKAKALRNRRVGKVESYFPSTSKG